MTRIWYCAHCGYEVTSRGRCHLCRERLVPSPLPELPAGGQDDEVGYRLEGWSDSARGWLIGALIESEIPHRFEDDELVVAADDETVVDDLVGDTANAVLAHQSQAGDEVTATPPTEVPEAVGPVIGLLAGAAARLRRDPTDMEADSEVAEASTVVFAIDSCPGLDDDTWAAVGRTTRRLLAALGSEEALDDEIRLQAGLLGKLLEPVTVPAGAAAEEPDATAAGPATAAPPDAAVDKPGAAGPATAAPPDAAVDKPGAAGPATAAPPDAAVDKPLGATAVGPADFAGEQTVYELPEWLPEQRAQLSLVLDDERINHAWDGTDLVVPAMHESEVEALFDRVQVSETTEEEDDARYRALEELFAATDRLANAPADEDRATAVVDKVEVVDGPTPLGFDDAQWWTIRRKAHVLVSAIEGDAHFDLVGAEAAELRDLLRAMV